MEITFLLDSGNNWIVDYINFNKDFSEFKQFKINLSFDSSNVKAQEIVFVLGYTKILSKEFISSNRLCLVIHESDLPKGKGFSPVQWQILEGNHKIPVCLIKLEEKVDSGDIFLRDEISLKGDELWGEIRKLQADCTIRLIKSFLNKYPDLTAIPQTGHETFYKKFKPTDDEIDPNKTIKELFNRLRIADNNNFPVYFILSGQKYYLKISKG